MAKRLILRTAAAAALIATPFSAGLAQMAWAPGTEITGHAIQVETNGVMNTIYFEPGGVARIQTPGGNVVPATWSAANGMLCLTASGAQECWPYTAPFQTGQQVVLTSSCQASRWLPISTAQPPMQSRSGERG